MSRAISLGRTGTIQLMKRSIGHINGGGDGEGGEGVDGDGGDGGQRMILQRART